MHSLTHTYSITDGWIKIPPSHCVFLHTPIQSEVSLICEGACVALLDRVIECTLRGGLLDSHTQRHSSGKTHHTSVSKQQQLIYQPVSDKVPRLCYFKIPDTVLELSYNRFMHLKGWFTAFFSMHDCVYGVQYNMYLWFFFFLKVLFFHTFHLYCQPLSLVL